MNNVFKRSTFSCFSPPVMIATFVIEIALALYVLIFRKFSKTVVLGALLLVFLAIFQIAEFGICERLGFGGSNWARIAFASITLLPPLGIHLGYSIAGKKQKILIPFVYALAAIWIALFIYGDLLMGQVCGGNYVVFNLSSSYDPYYFIYYNSLIVVGIWRAASFSAMARNKHIKKALKMLVIGYLSFIIPSLVVRALNTAATGSDTALPSIMCGFAVLLAIVLSFGVLPNASKKK